MKRIEEQLETIYALLAKGLSNSAIAKRVGVSERTIGKINNGESYWESGREYPVRKKEEERKVESKEPKERNGEIAEQEQELWRIAYELVVAQ